MGRRHCQIVAIGEVYRFGMILAPLLGMPAVVHAVRSFSTHWQDSLVWGWTSLHLKLFLRAPLRAGSGIYGPARPRRRLDRDLAALRGPRRAGKAGACRGRRRPPPQRAHGRVVGARRRQRIRCLPAHGGPGFWQCGGASRSLALPKLKYCVQTALLAACVYRAGKLQAHGMLACIPSTLHD